jgi:hypothetical protein
MRKLSVVGLTAVAVLALAGIALAENTYTVGGSSTPSGKGSKSKPIPIKLKFNFGVGNTESDKRGSPIETYAIGSEGLVTYPKYFPSCKFSEANKTKVGKSCKKAKVGGGLVQAQVGAPPPPEDNLLLSKSLFCNIKMTLYNISDAGKLGGMAIRLDTDPPAPTSESSRKIGCPTAQHRAIKARFVKAKIGGLTSSDLRFTVPFELLHPSGLANTVYNNESTVNKLVHKRKGKKLGFYSKIGCKGGKRTIQATFTSEDGVVKKATKQVKC